MEPYQSFELIRQKCPHLSVDEIVRRLDRHMSPVLPYLQDSEHYGSSLIEILTKLNTPKRAMSSHDLEILIHFLFHRDLTDGPVQSQVNRVTLDLLVDRRHQLNPLQIILSLSPCFLDQNKLSEFIEENIESIWFDSESPLRFTNVTLMLISKVIGDRLYDFY